MVVSGALEGVRLGGRCTAACLIRFSAPPVVVPAAPVPLRPTGAPRGVLGLLSPGTACVFLAWTAGTLLRCPPGVAWWFFGIS